MAPRKIVWILMLGSLLINCGTHDRASPLQLKNSSNAGGRSKSIEGIYQLKDGALTIRKHHDDKYHITFDPNGKSDPWKGYTILEDHYLGGLYQENGDIIGAIGLYITDRGFTGYMASKDGHRHKQIEGVKSNPDGIPSMPQITLRPAGSYKIEGRDLEDVGYNGTLIIEELGQGLQFWWGVHDITLQGYGVQIGDYIGGYGELEWPGEKIESIQLVKLSKDGYTCTWGPYNAPGHGSERGSRLYEAPKDYRTVTNLRLPFSGPWYVVWGGRTIKQNYHAAFPDIRYAYDFMLVENEIAYLGDGAKNSDYYGYGAPILAPGPGTVVEAIDGINDNKPGIMNPQAPLGNHVIIDHGHHEYSFLAHFKKGSVSVNRGQKVSTGEKIGLCGNSGNSENPHLHYHLQNTPKFGDGAGLPAQFQQYRDGQNLIRRGEPIQEDIVNHNDSGMDP